MKGRCKFMGESGMFVAARKSNNAKSQSMGMSVAGVSVVLRASAEAQVCGPELLLLLERDFACGSISVAAPSNCCAKHDVFSSTDHTKVFRGLRFQKPCRYLGSQTPCRCNADCLLHGQPLDRP